MEVLSCVGLFAVMCGVALGTGRFENFVVKVEQITKINEECKQTVEEQKETNANQIREINAMKEAKAILTNKIVELEAKNQAMNLTLTTMQGILFWLFFLLSSSFPTPEKQEEKKEKRI